MTGPSKEGPLYFQKRISFMKKLACILTIDFNKKAVL